MIYRSSGLAKVFGQGEWSKQKNSPPLRETAGNFSTVGCWFSFWFRVLVRQPKNKTLHQLERKLSSRCL